MVRSSVSHSSSSAASAARARNLAIAAAAALLWGVGCASYTVIPDADRARIEARHTGELLWVAQSLHAGPFYDDDRFNLVHSRRFEELTYLRTAEGDAIPPPPSRSVVPAGTRVRIERIEWPTGDVVLRRPIYTPRYTTWVVLRVARDRGEVTLEREESHILLLPAGIADEDTFDGWLRAALTAEDPNPWLRSLPQDQQDAIAAKQAVAGMDSRALTAALGFPDRTWRDAVSADGAPAQQSVERATWTSASVVLVDGVVTDIDDPQGLVHDLRATPPSTGTPPQAPVRAPAAPVPTPVAAEPVSSDLAAPSADPPEDAAPARDAPTTLTP